ncbi:MAG: hypothetical protein ABIZ69_06130, partial [Ilumatobacteraceae bacterium]
YEPAAASATAMLDDNASRGKALAHWKHHITSSWPDVKVVDVDIDTSAAHDGDQRNVRATIELGALSDSEVTVEGLHGPIDSAGQFINTPDTVTLQRGADGAFEATYTVGETGPYGVTVRAVPHHGDLISSMELGLVAWAN